MTQPVSVDGKLIEKFLTLQSTLLDEATYNRLFNGIEITDFSVSDWEITDDSTMRVQGIFKSSSRHFVSELQYWYGSYVGEFIESSKKFDGTVDEYLNSVTMDTVWCAEDNTILYVPYIPEDDPLDEESARIILTEMTGLDIVNIGVIPHLQTVMFNRNLTDSNVTHTMQIEGGVLQAIVHFVTAYDVIRPLYLGKLPFETYRTFKSLDLGKLPLVEMVAKQK